MTGDEPITGLPGQGRKPREWGIELAPIVDGPGGPATQVRVTLIDRGSGKRVGSRLVPWSEFRDVARGLVLVNVAEGVHE